MKEIAKVDLILENCDHIRLSMRDVNYIYVKDITQNIVVGWYGDQLKSLSCNNFEISIKKSSNKSRFDFDQENCGDKYKIFERLIKWKDITCVEFVYDDGSTKSIGVPWDDDSEEINDYMTTEITAEGDLNIKIAEPSR